MAIAACVTLLLASLHGAEAAYVELFHIYYQPLIVIVSMLWLWGLDVRIFETRLIRYDICFSNNDQKYLLSSRQLFQVGCHYMSGAQAKRAMSTACFFCLKCFWQSSSKKLVSMHSLCKSNRYDCRSLLSSGILHYSAVVQHDTICDPPRLFGAGCRGNLAYGVGQWGFLCIPPPAGAIQLSRSAAASYLLCARCPPLPAHSFDV